MLTFIVPILYVVQVFDHVLNKRLLLLAQLIFTLVFVTYLRANIQWVLNLRRSDSTVISHLDLLQLYVQLLALVGEVNRVSMSLLS